jgi:hypothetical protein
MIVVLSALAPATLILVCILFGLLLAAAENWEWSGGVLYIVSNVFGLANNLTSNFPSTEAGKIADVILSTWAMIMAVTVMGIVAGMCLITYMAEGMHTTWTSLIRYLLVYLPIVTMASAFALGYLIVLVEDSWDVKMGFYFMMSDILGLTDPLIDAEPQSAAGISIEIIAISVELTFAGAVVGLIGSHPKIQKMIRFMEGAEKPESENEDDEEVEGGYEDEAGARFPRPPNPNGRDDSEVDDNEYLPEGMSGPMSEEDDED